MRKCVRRTKEEKEYILKSPKDSHELSKELNMPKSTIRSIRRRYGRNDSKVFNPNKEEFIIKVEELDGVVHKIAEYYNVDRHTISKYAKKIGVKVGNKVDLSEDDIQRIISLYDECTAVKLALEYDVSLSYIASVWADNGLFGKENRQYHIDQSVLDVVDTEQKAYFLGFFAADGCLHKSKSYYEGTKQMTISIGIHEQDGYILKVFQDLFKTDKPISRIYNQNRFEISSNRLGERLIELGLDIRKTYGNSICSLDGEMMRHFLRGYVDGDGYICYTENQKSKNYISICGYQSNMEKIKDFLYQKNIYLSVIPNKKRKAINENDYFGVVTTTNKLNTYAFAKYLYKDAHYYLTRKKENADKIIEEIENSNNIRDKEIVIYYNYAVLDK